jgi:hypothetical protein
MVPRLIAATAAATLLLASAAAQSPTPPPATSSGQSADVVGKITQQSSDQWLASKLIGTVVVNQANEKIATINDLLLDKNGMPIAAVLNAGGFLGMGGKRVAVDLKSLQLIRSGDGSDEKATAALTKEQIQQAADFKPYEPPPPPPPVATNRGPSPMGSPSGSPSR